MILDVRDLTARQRQYDICIIGGGAAGITLARELHGPRRSICVLESGGVDLEADTQALYGGITESPILDRAEYLTASRLRFFGGTTNHWNGMCRPFDPLDFAVRPWVPESGWPITREDLAPYYRAAAALLQFPPFDEQWGEVTLDAGSIIAPGGLMVGRRFHFSPPTRFGTEYRRDLAEARNLEVLLHANALELQTNEAGTAVERVLVGALDGTRFAIRARLFVLAAGGVENPRLLLASSSIQQAGLGNATDCVGRYFMEHPEIVPARLVVTTREMLQSIQLLQTELALLSLSEAAQEKEEVLHAGIQFFGGQPEASEAGGVPLDIGDAVARIDRAWQGGERDASSDPPVMMAAFIRTESAPRADNRVTLEEREVDALGMRRARLRFEMGTLESRTVVRTFEVLARELGRRQGGRLMLMSPEEALEVPFGAPPWRDILGGSHHIGTTRMSSNSAHGVVDPDCRVHGMENVFVAGSSVFPVSGLANPTFTIVALALRLADHLSRLVER